LTITREHDDAIYSPLNKILAGVKLARNATHSS
jgi:hypothetical protein